MLADAKDGIEEIMATIGDYEKAQELVNSEKILSLRKKWKELLSEFAYRSQTEAEAVYPSNIFAARAAWEARGLGMLPPTEKLWTKTIHRCKSS